MPKGLFYYLAKRVGYAIGDFALISEGDRILVGVSGGKDSFALLDFLMDKQRKSPVKFDLMAYHIVVDDETASITRNYLSRIGVEFVIDNEALSGLDLSNTDKDRCFLCSWYRRKAIFFAAHNRGYNKVAFGHNMDDVVQTFLMNVFFKASISTMCPKQIFFDGQITVIRPLVYIREDELVRLAKERGYPKTGLCRWADENKREQMKYILSWLQRESPGADIVKSAFLSLMNVNPDYLPSRVGNKRQS